MDRKITRADIDVIDHSRQMSAKELHEYVAENPLVSKPEQAIIYQKFADWWNQAIQIQDESDGRDISAVVADLDQILLQARSTLGQIEKFSWPELVRSVTLEIDLPTNISLNKEELIKNLKGGYLKQIEKIRRQFRRQELLIKGNWQEKNRSQNDLRKNWLDVWLAGVKEKAEHDPAIMEQLGEIAVFVDERVNIVNHNNQEVIFLDWDRDFDVVRPADSRKKHSRIIALPPAIELLIADPRIGNVMLEYFAPELKANFNGENFPEFVRQNPISQKIIEFLKGKALTKLTDPKSSEDTRNRLFGFNPLAQACIKYDRDVLVGDIADSYLYMISRDIPYIIGRYFRLGLFVASTAGVIISILTKDVADIIAGVSGIVAATSSAMVKEALLRQGTQALEPNIIDRLHLYLEDARRLFLANAIDAATKIPRKATQPAGSTLVAYPPHHNNRALDNLKNPRPARQLYYKLRYPYLNYHLRRYSQRQEVENETAKKFSGWSLIDNIPLKIRPKIRQPVVE